jgi:CRP/FNR family transcriptional regulator
MTDETIAILKGSLLFSSLSDDGIGKIAGIATQRDFAAGASLISQGDQGALGMWIVIHGSLEVTSDGTTLATFGPGEHVGETSLVTEAPRSADVSALTDTTTLQITRWDLRGLIAAHPEIAVGIMDAMAKRLAKTNQALSQ